MKKLILMVMLLSIATVEVTNAERPSQKEVQKSSQSQSKAEKKLTKEREKAQKQAEKEKQTQQMAKMVDDLIEKHEFTFMIEQQIHSGKIVQVGAADAQIRVEPDRIYVLLGRLTNKPLYVYFDPPVRKGKATTLDVVVKVPGAILENGEYKRGSIYKFEIKDDGSANLDIVGQSGRIGMSFIGYIKPKARTI